MNILITGGMEWVGRYLSNALLSDGHYVTALGLRSRPDNLIEHPGFNYLSADTTQPGRWQTELAANHIVINLAGRSIFSLWTKRVKREIYESRILTTRNLVDALKENPDATLFSTSAVGYYGDRGDDIMTEMEKPGKDFLARLTVDWEHEALKAKGTGCRVVLPRFGIVLGKDGSTLSKMIPVWRMFLGGRLGSGLQWFSWIHIDDLIAIFRFLMEHSHIEGPFNACAPRPVRNLGLSKRLAEVLHRPLWFRAPAFAVKMLLGEFGDMLLSSQRVKPMLLESAGFKFRYPDITTCLEQIVMTKHHMPH